MTGHSNGNGRRTRAVVLWAFAAVLAALALATSTFVFMTLNARWAEDERACRGRITAHAEALRDARDSALADGLATTAIERQQVDTRSLAQEIRDLGKRVRAAGDLRKNADALCHENSDFTPP